MLIGETLDSILAQLTPDCELLVLDGGSTDGTEQAVLARARHCDRLRYVRERKNSGFDQDCDKAVELATGEYCWLMTDDDLIRAGAVERVCQALRQDFSLIIVNIEARDYTMSKVLQDRWLKFSEDRVYEPKELSRLFLETANILKYAGCVVVKRAIWMSRERARYYGSFFIYFGVIFQECLPGSALVISEPCISYRMGNSHVFSPRVPEILLSKWPALVRSVYLSEAARERVYSAAPWRHLRAFLMFRAMGWYSWVDYLLWVRPQLCSIRERLVPIFVALLPGAVVNASFVLYCSISRRPYLGFWDREWMLQFLSESRFRLWRTKRSRTKL